MPGVDHDAECSQRRQGIRHQALTASLVDGWPIAIGHDDAEPLKAGGDRSSESGGSAADDKNVGFFHPAPSALRASPSASDQNAAEECMSSTTSATARTNWSICRSSTTRGGAALSVMKWLPQICVSMPLSRNRRITSTCPNIP